MFLALVLLYAVIGFLIVLTALIAYTAIAYWYAERRFQKNLAVFRTQQQLEVVSMYGMTDEEFMNYTDQAPGMKNFS
jgi:hypothetical protein